MFQRTISSLIFAAATLGATAAFAQTAPDVMIKQVAGDVIESVKNDKAIQGGDISRIHGLVDTQVLPHVDLQRMTAAVVGKAWKTATPDQQAKLQTEFKTLLIRTYAGALTKVNAQTSIELKPTRALAYSNLIYTLHFLPGDHAGALAAERQRWNRQFSEPVKQFILPHANDPDPERRLRIGYVSPDFREHVVGRMILPRL